MANIANSVRSTEYTTVIGHIFNTPILVKGKTWFPISEILTWGIMTWVTGRQNPHYSWKKRSSLGALKMIAILGSEWCHNLAHTAAAWLVSKPPKAIRIVLGMPILIYPVPEEPSVTPRQHIMRSLSGPAFNALLLLSSTILRHFTQPNSPHREVANTVIGMNLFLSTAALIPNPEIDGGPALKWALVSHGYSREEADRSVKKANQVAGIGLTTYTGLAFLQKRYFLGLISGFLALVCLSFGFRKEK